MNRKEYANFTHRLVRSLEADDRVVGLVALGSMAAIDYLPDEWSDHDFFVVTRPGLQEHFRSDLSWLPDAESVAFSFRETAHGLKVVYQGGHLLEFAVFDPDELALAKVNRYRVLMDHEAIASRMADRAARTSAETAAEVHSADYLWGQFLTNILVGAGRYARGERVSGAEFVRSHAVRHLLLLRRHTPAGTAPMPDNLDVRRRIESADPDFGAELAAVIELPTLDCALGLLRIAGRVILDPPRDAIAIAESCVARASQLSRHSER